MIVATSSATDAPGGTSARISAATLRRVLNAARRRSTTASISAALTR